LVWSYHALTDVGLQVHHLCHASSLELHVDDHSVLAERLVLHHQGVNTIRQGSHSHLLSCVSFIFTFSHPHILIRHSIEFRRSIRTSSSIFPFVYHTFDLSHSCLNILFQIGLCNIALYTQFFHSSSRHACSLCSGPVASTILHELIVHCRLDDRETIA
jgi:hypothetical protein